MGRALSHGEGDVIDRGEISEALGQAVHAHQGFARGAFSNRRGAGVGDGEGGGVGKQAFGVVVPRVRQHRGGQAFLAQLAGFHDYDAVCAVTGHCEVVGDKKDAHAELSAHVIKQIEDDLLHGDIERGGGLIGDDEVGLQRHRSGNEHALLHAAGQLVWVLVIAALRIIDADALQQLQCLSLTLGGAAHLVNAQPLLHRGADGLHRVEGVIRILRDEPDAPPAQLAPLAPAQRGDIATIEGDGSGVDGGIRGQQTNGCHGGGGLTGAGLAHDGGHLPRVHLEVDALHGGNVATCGGIGHGEVPHVQQGLRCIL